MRAIKTFLILITFSIIGFSQNLKPEEYELIEKNSMGSLSNVTDTIEYKNLNWLVANNTIQRYYFAVNAFTKSSNDLLYDYVTHQPFLLNKVKYNDDLLSGDTVIIYLSSNVNKRQNYKLDLILNNRILKDSLTVESFPFSGNVIDYSKGLESIIKLNNIKEYNIIEYYSALLDNVYYVKYEIIIN